MRKKVPQAVASALQETKKALTAIYGEQLSGIYLYGSYARGDFDDNSDIDLMILLKGDIHPGQEIDRYNAAIAEICLNYGLLIATYPVPEHWLQERLSPLFQNVRREGVLL